MGAEEEAADKVEKDPLKKEETKWLKKLRTIEEIEKKRDEGGKLEKAQLDKLEKKKEVVDALKVATENIVKAEAEAKIKKEEEDRRAREEEERKKAEEEERKRAAAEEERKKQEAMKKAK